MDQYKEMYYQLFTKITDVINELETAQQQAEETFLSREPEQKDDLSELKKPAMEHSITSFKTF